MTQELGARDAVGHLLDVEQQLLELQESESYFDVELLNTVVRCIRDVQRLAGRLRRKNIGRLAQQIQVTCRGLPAARLDQREEFIEVLLRATDVLVLLVFNVDYSESWDVDPHLTALADVLPIGHSTTAESTSLGDSLSRTISEGWSEEQHAVAAST
jgi:hypothetical protein